MPDDGEDLRIADPVFYASPAKILRRALGNAGIDYAQFWRRSLLAATSTRVFRRVVEIHLRQ
jgi:hypothetical protein